MGLEEVKNKVGIWTKLNGILRKEQEEDSVRIVFDDDEDEDEDDGISKMDTEIIFDDTFGDLVKSVLTHSYSDELEVQRVESLRDRERKILEEKEEEEKRRKEEQM